MTVFLFIANSLMWLALSLISSFQGDLGSGKIDLLLCLACWIIARIEERAAA